MLALVLLVASALLAGAYLAIGPLLRKAVRQAAARLEAAPIAANWPPVIERHVPAVRALTEEQRARLLRAVRDLIASCHWEACGGLVLTQEMQLVIAAQACLLTLELPGEPYPNLHTALIYPGTFQPVRAVDPRIWRRPSGSEPEVPELGESWRDGTVVVAWDSALAGGEDPGDGRNLIIHEFPHLIDFRYGLAHGDPDLTNLYAEPGTASPGPSIPGGGTWRKVLADSFERHCAQVEQGIATTLGQYAATNEAEFFAVASEVFFERPAALRAAFPQLYEHLHRLFRQDPLARERSALVRARIGP